MKLTKQRLKQIIREMVDYGDDIPVNDTPIGTPEEEKEFNACYEKSTADTPEGKREDCKELMGAPLQENRQRRRNNTMKLTKTNLMKLIIREEFEGFRTGWMGGQRTTQKDGESIAKWTKKGYNFDSQQLDTVAIVKEPSGEILRVFHDVPREIVYGIDGSPDVKKAMGIKRGMKTYIVYDALGHMHPPPKDADELDKEVEELFVPRKDLEGSGKFRIPTYQYIEKHYPDMDFFDFNDYMAPQGPKGGKRPGKPVIGDL